MFSISIIIIFVFTTSISNAQEELVEKLNSISTAVPFLTITPNANAGAMGEVGVATAPDVNSMKWNASKYAFTKQDFGVSLSYTPWLRKLTGDMSLNNLTGYKRINRRQTVAFSLTYFTIGEIQFTDQSGFKLMMYNPNEFSVDGAYALQLSDYISGAISLRFILSDLTGGQQVSGVGETHAGTAYAGDLSFFYRRSFEHEDERKSTIAAGICVSNLGSKISYGGTMQNFIPANLRIGTAYTLALDKNNEFTFAFDINKLLVPTRQMDEDGNLLPIEDVAVPVAIVQSFYDAPFGLQEELHELMYSTGLEYWYAGNFAIRGGYFHEHKFKGARKYATMGIGLKLKVFNIDFSYLIPVASAPNNPLEETLRFTLGFNFGALNGS